MSGYIGNTPIPQATQTRDSFTATASQTSFATGGYTPNFLDVYLNGLKLNSSQFTATNGTDVVLTSAASSGDIVEVIAYTAFEVADASFDDLALGGDLTVGGTVDGRDIAADGTKLDGIESGATGDQTNAEIRAAVEAATDSNVFTDADHTKLNAIEASATADQTASEIRTLVESATDSNVFTDADHTKLNAIESGATADQTKSDIDALNINADTLDGQHGSYYTGYADTAVANIVDSAPGTLDTLNELAAALGDDPNFATTVTNSIATKLPLAGGTLTGNLDVGGTVTADGLTVDGEGTFTKNQTADTAVEVSNLGTAGANTTASFIVSETAGTPKGWFRRYRDGTATTAVGFSDKLVFEGAIGSTPTNRMEIASTGDISFYEDTGTTAKFFWDASAERLGLQGSDFQLYIQQGANQPWYHRAISNGNYALHLNGSGDIVTLDSSGNVGIGTNNPSGYGKFVVQGAGNLLNLNATSGVAYQAFYENGTGRFYLGTLNGSDGLAFIDADGSTERMRIDASGNLLVGKTALEYSSNTGHVLRNDGLISAVRSGGNVANFNRLSSDGEIIQLNKDGTRIGSIGSKDGDLTIGTGDTGLYFSDGADAVYPYNTSTQSDRDNAVDLGYPTVRFKDLYLSGSIANPSGNLTLDASGDINLDADGADINLKDGGTRFGILYNSGSNFYIEASVQDKDIKFLGNDGGSGITALTLDMSEGGRAYFANGYKLGDTQKAFFGDGNDLEIYHDGFNSYIKNNTGWLNMPMGGSGLTIANSNFSENLAKFVVNGAIELYHNGSKKFETTSSGVTVTGTVAATSYTGDGSNLTGVGGSTAAGAVGTYTWLYHNNNTLSNGATVSGSTLRDHNGNDLAATHNLWSGSSVLYNYGTWRNMSGDSGYANSTYGSPTLFVRIS